MQLRSLNDVLHHEIMDLYSAEKQILEALPKMADKAESEKLRKGFEKHFEQTKDHMARLEEAADELGLTLNGMECKAMKAILSEGEHLLEHDPSAALDAALISAAQRVEHYEIAAYGSAATMAEKLKEDRVADALKDTLAEEKENDQKLTEVAETEVNEKAAEL